MLGKTLRDSPKEQFKDRKTEGYHLVARANVQILQNEMMGRKPEAKVIIDQSQGTPERSVS